MKKKRRMYIFITFPVLALAVSTMILTGAGDHDDEVGDADYIAIFWTEGDQAEYLEELSDYYTIETEVFVFVDTVPRSDFRAITFTELAAHSEAFDIIVGGDPGWLGEGVSRGHFVELTEWVKEWGVDRTMAGGVFSAAGEYPAGSGSYWAVPVSGDGLGWSYRRDMFEDAGEKAGFKAAYGYELGVPGTWEKLLDIAEYFHRPSEGFYGAAIYTHREQGALTAGIENVLWALGSGLGDFGTHRVEGILNSRGGIDAVEFYRELYGYSPPGWGSAYTMEDNQAMTEGKVVMSMNYFSYFADLADPEMNPYWDKTGYFAMPEGPSGRFAAFGGQGASVVRYSKKRELALDWLEWFVRPRTQAMWGELGGFVGDVETLGSAEYLDMAPYNRAYADTAKIVKGFWPDLESAALLAVSQKHWYDYVVAGNGSAKKALDTIAKEWERIFRKSGYYE